MNWQEEMGREAARLAGLSFEDGDEIEVDLENTNGYRYSSWTYEDPSWNINVSVRRNGAYIDGKTFYKEDAANFFTNLMRGSE